MPKQANYVATIWDIDGTLIQSQEIDSEAYLRAFEDTFGHSLANSDWGSFTHVTDSGILQEALMNIRGQRPSQEEEQRMQKSFLNYLEVMIEERGLSPAQGAEHLFHLLREEGFVSALATGGWRGSAELKLAAAGIDTAGAPLVTASDFISREKILLQAHREIAAPAPVVYFGDGAWDYKTTQSLGWDFIAVDLEGTASWPREQTVLDGFSDTSKLLEVLRYDAA